MKIVVLGSGGRLGAALAREWRTAGDAVTGFNRQLLDIGNFAAVREQLEELDFDALVNCAALTNVDYCETHPEEADRLNGKAVATIADVCTRKKARLVHISTDYVFDGAKTKRLTENPFSERYPVFALDGKSVLFESRSKDPNFSSRTISAVGFVQLP